MKQILIFGAFCSITLLTACQPQNHFKDAVAVWSLSELNDQTVGNSLLRTHGDIPFISLEGTDAKGSVRRGGDGITAQFGSAWLDAGQGFNTIEGRTYVEATIGSDDIGGAHMLKYPLADEQVESRFDGLVYYDGTYHMFYQVWSGCWSGSAVVDVNNTAGFQVGEEKTIVAFITSGSDAKVVWDEVSAQRPRTSGKKPTGGPSNETTSSPPTTWDK